MPSAAVHSIWVAKGWVTGTSAKVGVAAAGSVPMFLASRSWVYHESAMWGMAWTLLALALLLRHRDAPTWGSLAAVFVATFGAVASRASVGAGACAALGLCALVTLVTDRQRTLRERVSGPSGAFALLLVAALPAAAYAGLNFAKFGTVASIPFEEQAFTDVSPSRQAMLADNGGTLFGFQFAPTTLVHYLRPIGGLDVTRQFPFVDFPAPGGPIVGDVTFDLVDRTASIPLSLPALFLGAVLGTWVLLRRRPDRSLDWIAVGIGASVGSMTIIPFGFIAQRYLADTMPLLVLLAALGSQAVVRAVADRPDRRRDLRSLGAWALLVVLVPASIVVNGGLATMYQRLYVPTHDPDLVRGLLDARTRVGAQPNVLRADRFEGGCLHAGRRQAESGARDADIVLVLIDARKGVREDEERIIEMLPSIKLPKWLILNKVDTVEPPKLLELAKVLNERADFAETFMISALGGSGCKDLLNKIAATVPEGPWYYPEDQISDLPMRQLAAEVTREKLYLRLHQELPYSSHVETERWEEKNDGSVRIEQVIYVERDSQKKIVLGKGGDAIKSIGQAARKEISEILDQKVHLFLFVKVRENWGDDPERYREMGLEFPH